VIGTSAQVYPAAGLALSAKRAGATLIEINRDPTPLSGYADVSYRGNATEMVDRWLNEAQLA
jgi:NAD-dependent deacetylase